VPTDDELVDGRREVARGTIVARVPVDPCEESPLGSRSTMRGPGGATPWGRSCPQPPSRTTHEPSHRRCGRSWSGSAGAPAPELAQLVRPTSPLATLWRGSRGLLETTRVGPPSLVRGSQDRARASATVLPGGRKGAPDPPIPTVPDSRQGTPDPSHDNAPRANPEGVVVKHPP